MQSPKVIEVPVVLSTKPSNDPKIVEEAPTLICMDGDYIEIIMHYVYSRKKISDEPDYDPADAWKQNLLPKEDNRVEVMDSGHFFIGRSAIGSIAFNWDAVAEQWYLELDTRVSPLIYMEMKQGREVFKEIITWWKQK